MLHNSTKQSENWAENVLMPELSRLSVTVEDEIIGLPWIKQISAMKKCGCKFILIITKGKVTNQFLTELIQTLSLQNICKPEVIPILYDCTLDDLEEEIAETLSTYTLLCHCDTKFSSRLQQSLFRKK